MPRRPIPSSTKTASALEDALFPRRGPLGAEAAEFATLVQDRQRLGRSVDEKIERSVVETERSEVPQVRVRSLDANLGIPPCRVFKRSPRTKAYRAPRLQGCGTRPAERFSRHLPSTRHQTDCQYVLPHFCVSSLLSVSHSRFCPAGDASFFASARATGSN